MAGARAAKHAHSVSYRALLLGRSFPGQGEGDGGGEEIRLRLDGESSAAGLGEGAGDGQAQAAAHVVAGIPRVLLLKGWKIRCMNSSDMPTPLSQTINSR